MKAIVTGCSGFVGSHVTDWLLKLGYMVTGIDNFRTGKLQFMTTFVEHPNFEFVNLDLNTLEKNDTCFENVEIVYHFAANADVRGGFENTFVDLEFNVLMTHKILECMRFHNIKRLCFASTAAALGEPDVFPTPEAIPVPKQTSIYGASKMSCEHFISAYSNCFGIEAHVFRFVSLLGPRYPHGHVIDFVRKLRKNPQSLSILGDGTAQKSYLHISDCIEALELICENVRPARHLPLQYEVFNLGYDGYIKVSDSAKLIATSMGLHPSFRFEKQIRGWVGDNPFVHLSTKKIQKLGWKAKFSIKDSIEDTVEWLLKENWVL